MSPSTIEGLISPEEYLAAERLAEEKSEYFAGRVVPMAGAAKRHNRIATNIGYALGKRLEFTTFEVFTADQQVMAASGTQYGYPDVVVAGDHAEFEDAEEYILLTPILIVEILSKSTERVDRGEKFERYKEIEALREYMLVSQTEHRVEQYTRHSDGWQLRVHEGLESSLWFESLGCDLTLSEIYRRVRVGPYPTGDRAR